MIRHDFPKNNRGLQDPPVCYACAFQHIWAEVSFPHVLVLNSIFSALLHGQLLLPDLQPDKLGRGLPWPWYRGLHSWDTSEYRMDFCCCSDSNFSGHLQHFLELPGPPRLCLVVQGRGESQWGFRGKFNGLTFWWSVPKNLRLTFVAKILIAF